MTNFMHRRSPVLANFTVHRNRAVSPSKTSLALFNRELSLTDVRTSFIRAVKFLLKNILTKSHIYIYPPLSLCHRNKPIYCRIIFPLDDERERGGEILFNSTILLSIRNIHISSTVTRLLVDSGWAAPRGSRVFRANCGHARANPV